MKNRQRVARLHHLHEQLLKQRESEQRQIADRVQSEHRVLQEITDSISEADQEQLASAHCVGDFLLWRRYIELLELQESLQRQTVIEWSNRLEDSREQTLSAFQHAKQWEFQHQRVTKWHASAMQRIDMHQADELAIGKVSKATDSTLN